MFKRQKQDPTVRQAVLLIATCAAVIGMCALALTFLAADAAVRMGWLTANAELTRAREYVAAAALIVSGAMANAWLATHIWHRFILARANNS